jgi:hypothetical protein
MILAVIKGLRNGFVVAVFSFLAIIIGLAAAMKLSTAVAGWLKDSTSISAAWLPFLSFALVMVGVVFLIRLRRETDRIGDADGDAGLAQQIKRHCFIRGAIYHHLQRGTFLCRQTALDKTRNIQ